MLSSRKCALAVPSFYNMSVKKINKNLYIRHNALKGYIPELRAAGNIVETG